MIDQPSTFLQRVLYLCLSRENETKCLQDSQEMLERLENWTDGPADALGMGASGLWARLDSWMSQFVFKMLLCLSQIDQHLLTLAWNPVDAAEISFVHGSTFGLMAPFYSRAWETMKVLHESGWQQVQNEAIPLKRVKSSLVTLTATFHRNTAALDAVPENAQ